MEGQRGPAPARGGAPRHPHGLLGPVPAAHRPLRDSRKAEVLLSMDRVAFTFTTLLLPPPAFPPPRLLGHLFIWLLPFKAPRGGRSDLPAGSALGDVVVFPVGAGSREAACADGGGGKGRRKKVWENKGKQQESTEEGLGGRPIRGGVAVLVYSGNRISSAITYKETGVGRGISCLGGPVTVKMGISTGWL